MVENLMMAARERQVLRSEADRERLQRMFVAYHEMVWRILRRRGLSREAAADATQEAFTIVCERLPEIEPQGERSFLIRTALQVAHTLGRKTVRWQLEANMDQRTQEARDTDEVRADVQLCDLALSRVDPDLVEVFVLYELEELTLLEIAELLAMPLGSVASRLRRARREFRSVFARIVRTIHHEAKS